MQPQPLKSSVVLLFAIACGLAVGNVYYAQPLLDAMAEAFAMSPASIGIVITLTQIGYGIGLVLLVPLGDLLNRRRLIVTQTLLSAVALLMIALAPNSLWLLLGMTLTGLLAVVTQVLVAYAATLAIPAQRGRVVGVVTSGIVVGILLARTVAGAMADLAGWRAIYLLSAGLTLLMAILLLRVLPRHESARPSSAYGALIVSVFRLFKQEPVLRQRAILALLTFASAMVLWTPMVLPLATPPLSLSHSEIGLFGLAGAAGALAAARAGHLADRGLGQWVSGVSLLLGVITLDLGLQAVHVTSQSMIYSVRPEAQSRLTAGYMLFYSIGSAVGSILSTATYAWAGWSGVCLLGAAINALALGYWWLTLKSGAPQRCATQAG